MISPTPLTQNRQNSKVTCRPNLFTNYSKFTVQSFIVMQKQKVGQFMNLEELKTKWDNFAPVYALMDTAMNTFFYQLVHMLKLDSATSIYDVGCGSGRLIHYAMTVKNRQVSYLAIDLSQTMISLTIQTIKKSLSKIPKEIPLSDYCKFNNLVLRASDGQKTIQPEGPFDRIVCNLVLMITENPHEMMRTFYRQAKEGCILGVTVIGNTEETHNYFLSIPDKLRKKKNLPPQKEVKNHKLHNKLKELGDSTGWDMMIELDQIIPFHFFEVDNYLQNALKRWQDFSKDVYQDLIKQIRQVFNKRETLNFPGHVAIFRKSKKEPNLTSSL